jgi:hypothetical protein
MASSSSVRDGTTGEWKFPECQISCTRERNSTLSVALREELHSGKRGSECLGAHGTPGRGALGEGPLPRVQHSGKRDTRGRKELEENEHILQRLFPECLSLALGKKASSPSARGGTQGN